MKEGCTFLVKLPHNGIYYRQCVKICNGTVRSKCYTGKFSDDCFGHSHRLDQVIAITSIPKNVNHNYQEDDPVYRFYGGTLTKVIYQNDIKFPNELLPYKWWILYENCKLAVMEISKCLLKCKIYNDVRLLIAKEVWNTRNDYSWRMKEKNNNKKIKV